MARKGTQDRSILEAALIGYQTQLADITASMAWISQQLGGKETGIAAVTSTSAARPQKKHRISAEGRARIAAAQRRRWAAQKKAEKAA